MSTISVPIDASQIPQGERGKQRLRVAVQSGEKIVSEVVEVTSGKAVATFDLDTTSAVTIAVGPESSNAVDLFCRNTPIVTVRPRLVEKKLAYTANPIVITLPIWERWLTWCRTFTISGYVYGPDGNPVPSAQVSAYNVDRFWWWSSTQQVGPTVVTNASGYFTMNFVWCCNWLPWCWWERRPWRLDPVLVEKIEAVLKLNPSLRVNAPSPRLELEFSELNPQPLPPGRSQAKRQTVGSQDLNPTTLQAIREQLLKLLPAVPEFERFCLWPWCPWYPWLDCDPNIIFKVTQSCGGLTNTIVNENVWQARQDSPTNLTVTLTANSDACTIPPPPGQPEGNCFLFTQCCSVDADDIGATGSGILAGWANPGSEDQPFTGQVDIYGQFGYSASDPDYADYYSIQYRPAGSSSTSWLPVPPTALQPFTRTYFDGTQPFLHQWFTPGFAPQTLPLSGSPGQFVTAYQSRQFYQQQNNAPANWTTAPDDWPDLSTARSWTNNVDLTAVIDTAGFFTDGAYEFQFIGYTLQADGSVLSNGVLPGCGQPGNYNNDFTLYLANPQLTTDSYISNVWFNGSPLATCGIQNLTSGVPFSFAVQFTASDAGGYLDSYSLALQWGSNAPEALFSCGCLSLATPCGLAAVSSGVQVGPCYADAIAQHATRPVWDGGTMTLTIPNASALFPVSCAYDLILTVTKRNIVDCSDVYRETAYYSFTVLLQP
jgi:hypothetical protein